MKPMESGMRVDQQGAKDGAGADGDEAVGVAGGDHEVPSGAFGEGLGTDISREIGAAGVGPVGFGERAAVGPASWGIGDGEGRGGEDDARYVGFVGGAEHGVGAPGTVDQALRVGVAGRYFGGGVKDGGDAFDRERPTGVLPKIGAHDREGIRFRVEACGG